MTLDFVVKIYTSLWIRLITQLGELISSLQEKQRSCVFYISTLTTTLEMTTFMKQNRWRCDTRVHVIVPIVGPHSFQWTCTSKVARRLHSCYTTKVWCAQLWEPLLINKWPHWVGEGGLGPTKPQTSPYPTKINTQPHRSYLGIRNRLAKVKEGGTQEDLVGIELCCILEGPFTLHM
jgi:hypothetical protein